MLEQNNNQNFGQKPTLMEKVDKFYAEQNDWKKMNGGCPISADIAATLELLKQKVHPLNASLPDMVKSSVLTYAAEGQTFEQIWADKIAEGANFVGVVDGVFGFYRGEEKLATNNKPLRISTMPVALQYREEEQTLIKERSKLARQSLMASLREDMRAESAAASPAETVSNPLPPDPAPPGFPEIVVTEGQL